MKISIFALSLLLLNTIQAAQIQCPTLIKTNQSLQEKLTGWDGFIDELNNTHHFNRISFYDGHPSEHASLAPDNSKGSKAIWTFDSSNIWLACGYSNTDVQLIQKLTDTIKRCSVNYNSDFSAVVAVNCV